MKSRRRDLTIAALTAVALLGSGCVRPGPPSVAMTRVEATLVFGVVDEKPVEQPLVQNVAAVAAPQIEPVETGEIVLPPLPPLPKLSTPTFAPKPKPTCPTAPPTAAAERAITVNVTDVPEVGVSRWKETGFRTFHLEGNPPQQQDVGTSFDRRIVRNYKAIADGTFSYEFVQDAGDDLVMVSTIQVKTNGASFNPTDGVGTVTTPGVREPEAGITLQKMDLVDPKSGQTIDSFSPTTGLLLLPLPARAGEEFRSVAVDPRTGQTIVHESVVKPPTRIDACGDLIDGILVESHRSESSVGGGVLSKEGPDGGASEYTYSVVFAPQYGGIVLQEEVRRDDEDCAICPFRITNTLGQLHPDPPTE